MVDSDRVVAQRQRRSRVRSRVIGDQGGDDTCSLIANLDRRARNTGPGLVGYDAGDDPAIGSLCQEQTTQAKNSKNNKQPHYEVGSHRLTLPIQGSPGCNAAPQTETQRLNAGLV